MASQNGTADEWTESKERNVLRVGSIASVRKRRPDCERRGKKFSIYLQALRLGVYSRLRLNWIHILFALDDKFHFGIAGVIRPIGRLASGDKKLLQDVLFGHGSLEIRKERITFKNNRRGEIAHRPQKPDIMDIQLEGR